jgi:hypothetical protein
MTKKELIEAVKDFPDDAPVWFSGEDCYLHEVISVQPQLDHVGCIILDEEPQ